jgi:anti-sigma factor RsiW
MTISEYLDDELEEKIRTQFEKHLKYCCNARAMVHTVERTIVLHQQAGGEELPEIVHTRLRKFIEQYAGDEDQN